MGSSVQPEGVLRKKPSGKGHAPRECPACGNKACGTWENMKRLDKEKGSERCVQYSCNAPKKPGHDECTYHVFIRGKG